MSTTTSVITMFMLVFMPAIFCYPPDWDAQVAQCRRQSLSLLTETCATTAQCCTYGGAHRPLCHAPSGRCTSCPNNGFLCTQASHCCAGDPVTGDGKAFCNVSVGYCEHCRGPTEYCRQQSDCCLRAGLVCQYDARFSGSVCR